MEYLYARTKPTNKQKMTKRWTFLGVVRLTKLLQEHVNESTRSSNSFFIIKRLMTVVIANSRTKDPLRSLNE